MKKKLVLCMCAAGVLCSVLTVASPAGPGKPGNNQEDPSLEIEYIKNGVITRTVIPMDIVNYLMRMAVVQASMQRKGAEPRSAAEHEQCQHEQPGQLLEDSAQFKPVTGVKTRLSDVGGAHAAKGELREIVEFLKDPKKFRDIGAKIPRGVLLFGPSGTGKTLIARAVAGEAGGIPFYSVKASELISIYVGSGARNVRELFEAARACARENSSPVIIFIDEFDSVGGKRTNGNGGGGDREHSQTLNQLLTEMDGFAKDDEGNPIIVIAATNRVDVLDEAAIRPGRFDRKVKVDLPDLVGRREILTACLAKIKIDSDVNADTLARATPGFSGAELANMVNEGALHAVAHGSPMASMRDFEAARDKMLMGAPSDTIQQTPEELELLAYHEAGHALVHLSQPDADPLYKVTIEAHGPTLGFAAWLPKGDGYSVYSKEDLLWKIMSALGGRIGEELGTGRQFNGVSSDLEYATSIARTMVCEYGMSDLGLGVHPDEKGETIAAEIRKIIDECEKRARDLLCNNRDRLDLLAHELLAKKTLSAQEVYKLLGIAPRAINSLDGHRV